MLNLWNLRKKKTVSASGFLPLIVFKPHHHLNLNDDGLVPMAFVINVGPSVGLCSECLTNIEVNKQ